jgi:DNA/RNA-binding domain of Phe-tRNA-synthetase-like protein
MIAISQRWREAYPGACVGVLVMRHVPNPATHPALDARKAELKTRLRDRFGGCSRSDLKELEPIKAYNAYLKPFKKTYPVQLQLESVVFKGKSIPQVAALVEVMFIAELEDLLLTAGHDMDTLQLPVSIDIAGGGERYIGLTGEEQSMKAGDMMISDKAGIISSVVYGPDQRTCITTGTRDVLFTTYAPTGITPAAVREHLQHIRSNVLLIAPEAKTEMLDVYGAG